MSKAAAFYNDGTYTGISLTSSSATALTLNTTSTIGGASAAAGVGSICKGNLIAKNDGAASTDFTISVPNVTVSAGIAVYFSCLHGDGTASHSGMFIVTVSRVAGSAAIAGTSTIGAQAQATSSSANSIAVTVGTSISGGAAATNAVRIQCTATKTGGTATTHQFSALAIMTQNIGSGATLTGS